MRLGNDQKVSKVEVIKGDSHFLRGTIEEALNDGTSLFSEENIQVLKFHGMYQQDDRDVRAQRKKEGLEKAYSMMIRARIPGGVLSPDQYLAFDTIADKFGNGTLRITTRQTFQVHGVLKGNVKPMLQTLHNALLTALGGCGDQVRNIIACGEPKHGAMHVQIRQDLMKLVDTFGAKTNAYHEIWLDGEKVKFDEEKVEEPIYGRTYLPRKFKIAFTVEGDNCVDVYSNDLGIVAHPTEDGHAVEGYTLLVGGGMGRTASDAKTYPRLATPALFVTPDELVEAALAIVGIQRDFGNRVDRRYSRFKYLLDENGMDWFVEELANRLGRPVTPPRALVWTRAHDHLGYHKHDEATGYMGLYIENGRVKDVEGNQLKTALRTIVEKIRPTIHLTTQQNLIFEGVTEDDVLEIEGILKSHGIPLPRQLSRAKLNSMACVALPTCGLATAESERALPTVFPEIEQLLLQLGLGDEELSIRMTGCANGCARPYISDIAFVGRSPGKYDVFLGGDFLGTRLNSLYKELVPIQTFVDELRPILSLYRAEREHAERFGAYVNRVGFDHIRSAVGALS